MPQFAALCRRLRVPISPLYAVPTIAVAVVWMAYSRLMSGRISFWRDEVGEFLLPVVFLVYAVTAWADTRAARPADQVTPLSSGGRPSNHASTAPS